MRRGNTWIAEQSENEEDGKQRGATIGNGKEKCLLQEQSRHLGHAETNRSSPAHLEAGKRGMDQ
jgi:hypothetical protein